MRSREFDYRFCNQIETFGQPLINFFSSKIFNGPAIEKVRRRYFELIENFELHLFCKDLQIPIDQINDTSLVGAQNIGIDLPVWFNHGERKKVMIVAMEPRRSDTASVSGCASLSTPFALGSLHVVNHVPSFSLVYNFVKYLVQSEHSVYVTDIGKIYSVKENKKQTGDACLNNAVFEFELQTFNPDIIICFGKGVLPLVSSIVGRSVEKQIEPIYFPHPASRIKRQYIELFNSIDELFNSIEVCV